MHDTYVATKTITLERDAYEKLKAAKQPGESFSDVVRRAFWIGLPFTGAALLSFVQERGPLFTEEELDSIDAANRMMDLSPGDP